MPVPTDTAMGCRHPVWSEVMDHTLTIGGNVMALQVINPATGEMIKTYDEMTPADVQKYQDGIRAVSPERQASLVS